MEVTGDIWSTGAFSFESPLKDLLDRGEYTLEELLAEDELLQELRGMHPQLIEFFSTEEAVVCLVKYVIRKEQDKPAMNGSSSPHQPKQGPQEETPNDQDDKNPGFFPPMEKPPKPIKTPEEEDDLRTVRFPYMACEIICCEINSIIDILVDGHIPTDEPVKGEVEDQHETAVEVTAKDPVSPPILHLLFSLLSDTNIGDMDDYRAGYFDKILSVLIRKRPKALSAYINEGGVTLMTNMCNHLYSHSIMQIVQRLLMPPPSSSFLNNEHDSYEEDENVNSLFQCQWSEFPESIELLLDSLIVSNNEDDLHLQKSQNASEVLITVIQNSPLTSPTLLALTTEPIMGQIVKAACTLEDGVDFSPHDSSLTCAMNVLESLVLQLGGYGSVGTALETSAEDDDEGEDRPEEDPAADGNEDTSITLEVCKVLKSAQEVASADTLIKHLPDLLQAICALLRHPSTKNWRSPMQFAKDEQQALLGMSRLRIVRLVESLVLLGNPFVDKVLCESECLSICLDLFWEFQWCSMLHQSVANLLVHVFEGANERAELQEYFLVKCNLLGRLMDSFEEPEDKEEQGESLSEAVLAIQQLQLKDRTVSVQSERGSSIGSVGAALGENDEEIIPVSDDDVDAALEQQAAATLVETEKAGEQEEKGKDTTENIPTNAGADNEGCAKEVYEVKSSIPSLRLGCLGHVIIICQALVHACTADVNDLHQEANESTLMRSIDLGDSAPTFNNSADRNEETESPEDEDKGESSVPANSEDDKSAEGEEGDSEGPSVQGDTSDSQGSVPNDLIIAELVRTHPLHDKWNDFITSTLAAETAIQSTPLGGTNVGSVESLQSQFPVARSARTYDFSDDLEDTDTSTRGFLGGEVLDMDDNDLDIAASMMEALNMSRPRVPHRPGESDMDNGGNERQNTLRNSFGTVVRNSGSSSGDYLFDDPLGGNARFGTFGQTGDSSDEEEEPGEGITDSGEKSSADDDDEAPVMDLFTGNVDEKVGSAGVELTPENGTFTNFANFDDAFAAADAFSAVNATEAPIFSSGSNDEDKAFKAIPGALSGSTVVVDESVEDLFGTTPPHSLLLGDEDGDNDVATAERAAEDTCESLGDARGGANTVTSAMDASVESPDPSAPMETSTDEATAPEIIGAEPKLEAAMSG